MIRYITDANVLKTQLFLVCFLNTTIFKNQEHTFLLDYFTHLYVKIFQRSYKMLDHWIRVFPIRDELGPSKHRFQFSSQKGNLLHLNIYVSKMFSQFKNPPPHMGLSSSQSRSARITTERSFSGYFRLTRRQEVQEILRESLAREIFGSAAAQENRMSLLRSWTKSLQPHRFSERWFGHVL